MRDRVLKNRISTSSKNILLLGPRQVGKSTLCREFSPARIVDLADEQVYLSHAKDAGLIKRELSAAKSSGLIVIDEIQRLSSYRTERGAEVDLVIERDNDILGIEIKSGRNASPVDSRGLFSLAETVSGYKPVEKWIVYTGNQRLLLENGVHVLPYRDALEELEAS